MKKLIFIVCLIPIFLIGCGSADKKVSEESSMVTNSNGITELKFKDMIDVTEIEKLDGKKVKMIGFFAQSSPLDGSMVYLMNMPYQNCVYCLPNTTQLMNTMAVFPKQGKEIKFTDLAVEVTGTIKFEDYTDEMGYSYNYRIVDAEFKLADVDSMSEEIKIYTDLVDKGFPNKISDIILLVNNINTIKVEGGNLEEIDLIPEELIDELYSMFDGLDKSKYEDILSVVSDLEILVDNINNALISKDYDSMERYIDMELYIFYDVYEWLMKPQV